MTDFTKYFGTAIEHHPTHEKSFVFIKLRPDLDEKISLSLLDLVERIHHEFKDAKPSNWIYKKMNDAFTMLQNVETGEDFEILKMQIECVELAEERLEWAKEEYFQEIVNYMIEVNSCSTIARIIELAQIIVIEEIYEKVWEFLSDYKEKNLIKI